MFLKEEKCFLYKRVKGKASLRYESRVGKAACGGQWCTPPQSPFPERRVYCLTWWECCWKTLSCQPLWGVLGLKEGALPKVMPSLGDSPDWVTHPQEYKGLALCPCWGLLGGSIPASDVVNWILRWNCFRLQLLLPNPALFPSPPQCWHQELSLHTNLHQRVIWGNPNGNTSYLRKYTGSLWKMEKIFICWIWSSNSHLWKNMAQVLI